MPKAVQGFTLIELMVVISIIAIMAAVGLIVYSTAQQNGRDSKRVQDVQEIQKAVEEYYAINNSYPNNVVGTLYSGIIPNALTTYFQANVIPTDPQNGVSGFGYKYIAGVSTSCAGGNQPHYLVCAKLENCGGNKCNRNALPSDGCQTSNDANTPKVYYCVAP